MPKQITHFCIRLVGFSIIACVLIALSLATAIHTSVADNEIIWGVDFSESQAVYLGLVPNEVYTAIIEDLGARHIKIHINWNATETAPGTFNFTSLDAQVKEAERNGVKLILVVGMKTGRWPECHTPTWFADVPVAERQATIVSYVETIVFRYKDSHAVQYWQLENEPLLEFGTCPSWYYEQDTSLLRAEVDAVRAIDSKREIIISDSGELSTWTDVAEVADIVGITMYRSSWNTSEELFGLNPYTFLSPTFYAKKAAFIEQYYDKPVISIELQAEPWTSVPLAEASLVEQDKSMNRELFVENVTFAKQAGLSAYYFWGVEWWYWMKMKHGDSAIWDEAKSLFAAGA
jgi:hypothetical protein